MEGGKLVHVDVLRAAQRASVPSKKFTSALAAMRASLRYQTGEGLSCAAPRAMQCLPQQQAAGC